MNHEFVFVGANNHSPWIRICIRRGETMFSPLLNPGDYTKSPLRINIKCGTRPTKLV